MPIELPALSLTRGLCTLLKYDALQILLDQTEIVASGMSPFRIAKVIGVVRDPGAGQFECQIRVIEAQVAFEAAEERFRHSIVPTFSTSAYVANDLIGFQRSLVFIAGIVAPSHSKSRTVSLVEDAKGESTTLDADFSAAKAS